MKFSLLDSTSILIFSLYLSSGLCKSFENSDRKQNDVEEANLPKDDLVNFGKLNLIDDGQLVDQFKKDEMSKEILKLFDKGIELKSGLSGKNDDERQRRFDQNHMKFLIEALYSSLYIEMGLRKDKLFAEADDVKDHENLMMGIYVKEFLDNLIEFSYKFKKYWQHSFFPFNQAINFRNDGAKLLMKTVESLLNRIEKISKGLIRDKRAEANLVKKYVEIFQYQTVPIVNQSCYLVDKYEKYLDDYLIIKFESINK